MAMTSPHRLPRLFSVRQLALAAVATVSLAACDRMMAPSPDDAAQQTSIELPSLGADLLPDALTGRARVYTMNYSLEVQDPPAALEQLRKAMLGAEGQISHASASATSASLNGTIDPDAHDQIRGAIAGLGPVTSENVSHNDIGQTLRDLQRRAHLLRTGDAELAKLAARATSSDTLDALLLQRQLGRNEYANVSSQLANHQRQVERTTIYVSFSKRAAP